MNKLRFLPALPALTLPFMAFSPLSGIGPQEEPDYLAHFRVFTGDGRPASLDDIVRAMSEAEAVLVGEIHTDPVGHWIEAELLKRAVDTYGSDRPMALSLEMFERDVQGIVDEYLQDLITERQFQASARPWEHYDTDYRAMVELAKAEGLSVLAANAPRRYVNRVSRLGPESLADLPPAAKRFLPPLPYPEASKAYRDEWIGLMTDMPMQYQCDRPETTEGEGGGTEGEGVHPPHRAAPDSVVVHHAGGDSLALHPTGADTVPPPHGMAHDTVGPAMPMHDSSFMSNGLAAQALWDASMAHVITGFLEQNPGGLVLHMVGGFHVRNHTGTPEKVEFYRPGNRPLVISMELAEDIEAFDPNEHGGAGDFVILTDKALDLGYERNCLDQETGR